jgi:hypothetical protein
MTTKELQHATDLAKEIELLEKQIQLTKTQTCHWIEFTYGNGSNRANVCNNAGTIHLVRELILKENEAELERLKQEFANL